MMQPGLHQEFIFKLEELKPVWRISYKQCKKIGDDNYVIIEPWSHTLKRMVFEDNPMYQHAAMTTESLWCAKGLQQMMDVRNKTQADELSADSGGSSLWANEEAAPAKRSRIFGSSSQNDHKVKREGPSIIDVKLEVDGVDCIVPMQRPVHPADHLCVLIEASVLGTIVKYLRANGFHDPGFKSKVKKIQDGDHAHVYADPAGLGVVHESTE